MESKTTMRISVLAILISFFAFFHSFLVTEFGLLVGSSDYDLRVHDYLLIYNSQGALMLQPNLVIHNDGTRPLRVNKARALLQLGTDLHVFNSAFVENISPQSVWTGGVQFHEDLDDGETQERDELMMDISNYIIDVYKSNRDKQMPIFLNPELISRVERVYAENADWMKHDENYYLLVLLWMNDDKNPPTEKHLFKFKFNSFQKKIITEHQLTAASMPRPDLIPSNLSVSFYAKSRLEKIEDAGQVARKYQEYEKLAID